MRKIYLLVISTITSANSFCQDYQVDFNEYLQDGDTLNQRLILEKWEKDNPKDAELFTSYFNYYFSKSKQEYIALKNEEPKGDSFIISDSLKNTVGYLGGEVHYNLEVLEKGIDKINIGIDLYPNRLDMRFGKIYAFGQIDDWERFTREIIVTVNYSSVNKNQWTWTKNEKMETDIDDFLLSIQDYQLQLYDTGDDNLLINMREIALAILKHYPDHVASLSNISITYMIVGEYDKAIEYLLKAEKLNPEDYIVLSNIAEAYKRKGDKEKAIEYYKKTLLHGDEQAKEYAEHLLKEMQGS